MYAQIFLGLVAAQDRTISEAQRARVITAINNQDADFLRGLERYRTSAGPLLEDDDKLGALLYFFSFGHQVFQHSVLQIAALLSMTNEYLRVIPAINKITDNNNKFFMSTISKQEGYTFA